MLLGDRGSRWRCLLVWVSGSTMLGAVAQPGLPHAARLLSPSLATEPLDLALVDVSAGVVLVCALWGWLALCATVAEAWRGIRPVRRGPWRLPTGLRRLVLAACGVALVSGVATPAHADASRAHRHPHGLALLSGLPLPDRAVVPSQHRTSPPIRTVTVRPGDTLWSIARRDLPAGASAPAIAARWHAIYHTKPSPHRRRPGPHRARAAPPHPTKGPAMIPALERSLGDDHQGADVLPLPRSTPVASVQGTLALDLGPPLDAPEPEVARRSGVETDVVNVDLVRRRRFEQHAARIGAALVEIVGGDRPVSQVLRWTTPEVYQDLARRAHLVAAAAGRQPGSGGVQSVRPQLVGAHTSFVSETCAEVSLHVRYGRRSRAVAVRFELIRDRWQVSALEFA